MKTGGREGFTLIELLVVVAIVGLLAAVAIPKYKNLLEKANLGTTMGNLSSLRSSLSIYYATNMAFPNSIDPAAEPAFESVLNGGVPFVKAKYPAATPPYGNSVTVSAAEGPVIAGAGWFYNNSNGTVFINSTAFDINGTVYSAY
ncbi:MAG: prepilin-type N-terminal cleavage/methylation domain-containing protein [Candidatus Goldbacteria bacterium]|nr:prepilin-type N-terminal cleavage/methylation domain-containing protein [Candidatus Goldiibacteriota bacterium]